MGLGKIAVVIGCGPATGWAVAKRFAQGGYSIALVSRKAESAKPVYDHITENGGKALMISADTGKEEDVKRAYKEIVDEFKASPEVLVYNARGGDFKWPPPKILDVNPADFEAQFAGGVTGALLWMQQLVPEQMKAKKGTIILTGATAGLRGGAGFSLLSPYKFALRSLGQTAAREFQPKGIHVAHVIVDGMIRTPQSKEYAKDVPEENFLQPDAIAEAYWNLHLQDRSAWTQELDLRPFTEKF